MLIIHIRGQYCPVSIQMVLVELLLVHLEQSIYTYV